MPLDEPDVRGLPVYDAHEAKLAAMRAQRTKLFEPEMLKRLERGTDIFNLLTTCHVPAEKEAVLLGAISNELRARKCTSIAAPDGTTWTIIDVAAGAAEGNPAKIPMGFVADALLAYGGVERYSGIRLHGRDYALHELYAHDKEKWLREKPDKFEPLARIHGRCGTAYLQVRDSARACDEFIASAHLDSSFRSAAIEECLAIIARDGTDGKFVTHSGAVLTCEDGDLLLVDGAPLPSFGAHQRQDAEASAQASAAPTVPPRTAHVPASTKPRCALGLSAWELALGAATAAVVTVLAFAAGRTIGSRPVRSA